MKVLARPGVLSVRVGSPDIKARVVVWVEAFIEILIVRDRWPLAPACQLVAFASKRCTPCSSCSAAQWISRFLSRASRD